MAIALQPAWFCLSLLMYPIHSPSQMQDKFHHVALLKDPNTLGITSKLLIAGSCLSLRLVSLPHLQPFRRMSPFCLLRLGWADPLEPSLGYTSNLAFVVASFCFSYERWALWGWTLSLLSVGQCYRIESILLPVWGTGTSGVRPWTRQEWPGVMSFKEQQHTWESCVILGCRGSALAEGKGSKGRRKILSSWCKREPLYSRRREHRQGTWAKLVTNKSGNSCTLTLMYHNINKSKC